jgi:Ca2+-binding EF-hand superfamily protein
MQFPGAGTQQKNSIASQMFRALDKNGDGEVTEEEFFAPHEQRFDALDTNHDGKLTSKEFESGSIFGQSQGPAK